MSRVKCRKWYFLAPKFQNVRGGNMSPDLHTTVCDYLVYWSCVKFKKSVRERGGGSFQQKLLWRGPCEKNWYVRMGSCKFLNDNPPNPTSPPLPPSPPPPSPHAHKKMNGPKLNMTSRRGSSASCWLCFPW